MSFACIQVDDLLQSNAICLLGPQAVHAVAISHAGFQLYPLDEDQEGLDQKPDVAAAFVPIDEDESGSSGSDSDAS